MLADQESFDRIYRPLLVNVVRVADVDGDGRLDEKEYLGLMQAWYNAHESDAVKMFHLLDLDGDGYLTLDELISSATGFFLDEDPILRTPPPSR